jgi:Family of unknown function (DUF6152)
MSAMRKTAFLAAAAAATLTGLFAPAYAHHSFAAFDQTRKVEIKGVVKEFQYTNPHSWLMINVDKTGGGTEMWSIEMLSPSVLSRMGWKKNTLKPGDKVTVTINPVRDGSLGGNMVSIVRADGSKIGGPQE